MECSFVNPLPAIEFQLRAALPPDVPLILGLIRELADFERLAHEVVADEETLSLHLFGARPAAEVVLGFVDNEPAGFALFFQNFSTFVGRPGIYLEDLYVRPAFRSQGLGSALLRHLARLAVSRGCGRFDWSVLEWNEDAIRFYEKLGARLMSEWRICRVTGDALAKLGQS